MSLENLLDVIVEFRDERDWAQFHKPKDLGATISIEAAELQELFLWRDEEEIADDLSGSDFRRQVQREVADVLIFAFLLCDALDFDPENIVRSKLEENANKYPVSTARGKSTKYTGLGSADAE